MLRTYRATLKGDRVEWSGEEPERALHDRAVPVYITLLEDTELSSDMPSQGQRMADALEKLAAINALAHIDDPVAWQREQRRERPLPGRQD